MTIVNGNSRVVNKLEASLTDDARVVIYDRHMFIVQATGSFEFLARPKPDVLTWYLRPNSSRSKHLQTKAFKSCSIRSEKSYKIL